MSIVDVEDGKETEKHGIETQSLFDLEYNEKHSKTWKNENCTLKDLEYGEKSENHGK